MPSQDFHELEDLMACTEEDDEPWESPFLLMVAMYLGRFISHPMCRPIIAKWSDKGVV